MSKLTESTIWVGGRLLWLITAAQITFQNIKKTVSFDDMKIKI